MLQIETILCRAGKMDNYSYIIHDSLNHVTAVVDPSETAPIANRLQKLNLSPQYIFNTHHHFDHTDANLAIKELYNAKIVGNIDDAHRIPGIDISLSAEQTYTATPTEIFVTPANTSTDFTFQIIDVSAHTIGHVLYYFPQSKALFTGDTLFNLCIGGLFEGSIEQMYTALQKIKKLPSDTLFYPGHEYTFGGAHEAYLFCNGNQHIQQYLNKAQKRLQQGLPAGPMTIAEESLCNPYLAAPSLEEFKKLF